MQDGTKVCADCGKRLPIDDFYKSKNCKDGHAYICKTDAKRREEERRRKRGVPIKNPNRISADMKKCAKCGMVKPISDFYKRKDRQDCYKSVCITCARNRAEQKRRENGVPSYTENTRCTAYLGIHVAERILSRIFKNVIRMQMGNKGYDFICSRGYKIDVKSSTINTNGRWQFDIGNNKMADFFLCLAFDNRDNLNPEHLWLIPGNAINNKKYITTCRSTANKWSQWERPIEEVVSCCNAMKQTNNNIT